MAFGTIDDEMMSILGKYKDAVGAATFWRNKCEAFETEIRDLKNAISMLKNATNELTQVNDKLTKELHNVNSDYERQLQYIGDLEATIAKLRHF